jgi:hypothetical protein
MCTETLTEDGLVPFAHWHTLVHFIHAPHGIMCGRLMMCTETLTEDGLVPFDQYLSNIHAAAEEKQSVVFFVLVLLLLVTHTIVFSILEFLCSMLLRSLSAM